MRRFLMRLSIVLPLLLAASAGAETYENAPGTVESACVSSLLGRYRLAKSVLDLSHPRTHRSVSPHEADVWPIDGQPPAEMSYRTYNASFFKLMGQQSIEDFARTRRAHGLTAHVADLFGSAVFSKTPEAFDSLTGVRLKELAAHRLPENYLQATHWREVTGDLLRANTWRALDESLRTRGIPALDLITIRPYGPLSAFSTLAMMDQAHQDVFFAMVDSILDRAWRRLTDQEGVIVIEFPDVLPKHPRMQAWVQSLEHRGVDIELVGRDRLRIVRHLGAPERLQSKN